MDQQCLKHGLAVTNLHNSSPSKEVLPQDHGMNPLKFVRVPKIKHSTEINVQPTLVVAKSQQISDNYT